MLRFGSRPSVSREIRRPRFPFGVRGGSSVGKEMDGRISPFNTCHPCLYDTCRLILELYTHYVFMLFPGHNPVNENQCGDNNVAEKWPRPPHGCYLLVQEILTVFSSTRAWTTADTSERSVLGRQMSWK